MRDDAQLVDALIDAADHIAFPAPRDLSAAVVARLPIRQPRRRRVVAIAVACALVVSGVLAVPGPREAVADWLGIGTLHIVRVDQLPTGGGSTLFLGVHVPVAEAKARAPFPLVAPKALGAPSAAYVDGPALGAVTLAWAANERLPAVRDTDVGLLFTQIAGSVERALIEKRVDPDTTIETVTINGAPAYWITGGHHALFYVAPNGSVREATSQLDANTLLWSVGDVVFRMESTLDRDAAVDLASRLGPLS